MKGLKLLALMVVLLLMSSTVVQAGFWDFIKKSLGMEPPQQQVVPKPQSPPPPTMQDVLKQQQPPPPKGESSPASTIPAPKPEEIPKPDSQKVFREAANAQNAKDIKSNKAFPFVAKKSDFFTSYPIILIHGLDGSPDSLFLTQYQLATDGIAENKGVIYSSSSASQLCPQGWSKSVSVNFEYYEEGKNKGIDFYADKLAKAVETLNKCTGSTKVNIIAHSMGGLISRSYMVKYGSGSSVNRLIMLETPNYGTTVFGTLANLKGGDADLMVPGSQFLKWLNSKDCGNRNRMVNIASKVALIDDFVGNANAEQTKKEDSCKPPLMSMVVLLSDASLLKAKSVAVSGCSHSGITSPRDCPKAYENVKTYLR